VILFLGVLSGLSGVVMVPVASAEQFMLASDVYRHAAEAMLAGEDFYAVSPARLPGYRFIYPPIVILLFGLGLFFAAGSVLLGIGVDAGFDQRQATTNAEQRLLDVLTGSGDGLRLSESCVQRFFEMETETDCGLDETVFDVNTTDEVDWLHHSLGLEDALEANVTLVGNSTDRSLGATPPTNGEISETRRFLADGQGGYATLYVRVW